MSFWRQKNHSTGRPDNAVPETFPGSFAGNCTGLIAANLTFSNLGYAHCIYRTVEGRLCAAKRPEPTAQNSTGDTDSFGKPQNFRLKNLSRCYTVTPPRSWRRLSSGRRR